MVSDRRLSGIRCRNKYGAIKVRLDGYTFASKAEARRYGELKLLEKAGEIRGLRVHVRYPLYASSYKQKSVSVEVCTYEADFAYWLKATPRLVKLAVHEDVKSKPTRTPLYRLKRKLFEANYGIRITEVE